MNTITIVIPVYNEAENIETVLARIEQKVRVAHTISVVYDQDDDTTVPVVRKLQATMSGLELVKNRYGRGVLNAIKTGMELSQTEYTAVTMADLCDEPEIINTMFELAERENAAIVCASRYMKGGKHRGGPLFKKILSRVAGLTLHWFAGVAAHDSTNGFKLYRTSFLRQQSIESTGGFALGLELIAKAHVQGYVICETPTRWKDRVAGKSNFKLWAWLPDYLQWYFYAFKRRK
ncbi:dolichol-phosphate mannosyltransferase [Planctomycetales bacterium]|nr:dolichol-phosphate mannosyltransferase [Planctomycetales bacterium]GHT06727.1 dolichol-phosphate mannosyltransferase [Planctomycetales bacterium]